MLKVTAVVDKTGTAIDRLAKGVAKFHSNLDYRVVDVHPKRPSQEQLKAFTDAALDADIIDWQYFKSAEMLCARYTWLDGKKQMLAHYNPYSIESGDWNGYDLVTADNQYIYERLGKITQSPVEYIGLTVDTDFWTFNSDWKPNRNVIMVANRIESKKGILEVAMACAELNLHFILVGAISDPEYFYSVKQAGPVEFHERITDEKLRELYHKSTIHVCNSVDGFESGTLPILEAMLCGVPVITRKIGHVPELYNGENMVIHERSTEDVEAIKNLLQETLMDKKKLESLRDKGWQSAKSRSNERRAYTYQKLYRQLLSDKAPVSVVVPVCNRPETTRRCLDAIARQSYKNIEVILADDSLNFDNLQEYENYKKFVSFPVRYINTGQYVSCREDVLQAATLDKPIGGHKDYGLARARNLATIEATGDIMVYCDQRMIMEPDAIERFVERIKPKYWLYGNKGARKEFVENFSAIYRRDIINAGMFSERCTTYGGLSQETRIRVRNQGIQTEFVEAARAMPLGKSNNRNRKRGQIVVSKNMLWKMGLEA